MSEMHEQKEADIKRDLKDADICTALGLGVGALGLGTGLLAGTVCPLCYVVAPGLVAVGVGKRWLTKCNKDNNDIKLDNKF